MKWVKRDSCNSIKDVVLRNMSMTEAEYDTQMKTYPIKDLDKAAEIIRDFISRREKITVVGDYDADGIDASAILKLMLQYLKADFTIRLPRRFSEGYGLSEKIVDEIESGLLLTVDNGIVAVEAIRKAKDKGLTVIILDHHLERDDGLLPEADVIIDPEALPGTCEFTGYCGAGLAYKLAQLMVDNTRILNKMSCFAAIGTIADVMDITHENKKIVTEGLRNLTQCRTRTAGLSGLIFKKNMGNAITAKDIGFSIGPVINAAGRLIDDGAEISLDVISFDGSLDEGKEKAEYLISLNEERKEQVKSAMDQAERQIVDDCMFGDCPMILYLKNSNEGIIGIIAGKIAEKYNVPCFVFTDSEREGYVKGSGRSVPGVHLKELLDDVYKTMDDCDSELPRIPGYGGHEGAGALSLRVDSLDWFFDTAHALCPEVECTDTSEQYYDLEIEADKITDTWLELVKYGPYGRGNDEIVFKINNFELLPQYYGYYTVNGVEKENIRFANKNCSAMGFGLSERYFKEGSPKKMNLYGVIGFNNFGKSGSLQIEMMDLEKVEAKEKMTPLARMIAERAVKKA